MSILAVISFPPRISPDSPRAADGRSDRSAIWRREISRADCRARGLYSIEAELST